MCKQDKYTLEDELVRCEEAILEGDFGIFEAGNHLELLEEVEKRMPLQGGPGWPTMETVLACAITQSPMPKWLRQELCVWYLRAAHGRLGSWDEAFGRPATRAEASRMFRKSYTSDDVMDLVIEAKLGGGAIDNDLFEEIGRKVGLARETTKKLYVAAGGQKRLAGTVRLIKKARAT